MSNQTRTPAAPVYVYVITRPGERALLPLSIASVRRVDLAARVVVIATVAVDSAGVDCDRFVFHPHPGELPPAILLEWMATAAMDGARLLVKIAPDVILTGPARSHRARARGVEFAGALSPKYWSIRRDGLEPLRLAVIQAEAIRGRSVVEGELGSLPGFTFALEAPGAGLLAGFDFQRGGGYDPERYRLARAITFSNALPAGETETLRVEAMQWLFSGLAAGFLGGFSRPLPESPAVAEPLPLDPLPVDVVVTSHEPYLRFLPEVFEGWAREAPGGRLILVLDSVIFDDALEVPPGWLVVRGEWGHPSGAREAGLAECVSAWVIFHDADNEVPAGYRAAIGEALAGAAPVDGYFGPAIAEGNPGARDSWGCDTNGLWRVDAIRLAGGWPVTWLEDWSLGARLESIGFELRPWRSGLVRRSHGEQRGASRPILDRLWSARVLTVVTLQRSEAGFDRWADAFKAADLPDRVRLVIVCDHCPTYWAAVRRAGMFSPFVEAITVVDSRSIAGPVTFRQSPEPVRHGRVSGLFCRAVPYVQPDSHYVLTWEDDVFPEDQGAVRALCDAMRVDSKVGAIAGAYPGRNNPRLACASLSSQRWEGIYKMAELPAVPFVVGSVGAGFTLWRGSLWPLLGTGPEQKPQIPLGWDACSSRMVNELGFQVLLHGGVVCAHGAY
jgi:hypothetical protein